MSRDDLIQYGYSCIFAVLMVGGLYGAQTIITGESGFSAINVSTAASTLFLLGIVLLLGPLSRLFSIFDRLLLYRKELGIMAFFVGLTHVYLVMFPLARHGPWGLYQSRPFSAYPGLEALILLFILFLLSWKWAMRILGTKLWWQVQYWGVRATFILIVLHMVVLKYTTIIEWVVPRGHPQEIGPPLIVWEAQFVLLVLLIRFSELFGKTLARRITQISTVLIVATMILVAVLG